MESTLRERLSELVAKHEVVLFMKGTRHFPQCGFSSQVVAILNDLGAAYETVNVLADAGAREGMKELSSWPTFPQLYVRGAFVGGCDIVREMHATGELQTLLGAAPPKAPVVTVTEGAAAAFSDALREAAGDVLRLEVSPEFEYDLHVGPKQAGDLEVAAGHGIALHVASASARRADGMRIDFVTKGGSGAGFKIDNPNEPPRVRSMSVEELKTWLDKRARGEASLELFDVRTPAERERARIEGAKEMNADVERGLDGADKGTMLVFHCHHGMRSRSAAEHFLREGFRNVWNVEGGIDAWSLRVDPTVARY